ncbi:hypothetical protein Tco_0386849 [Tanacetum coccineum]
MFLCLPPFCFASLMCRAVGPGGGLARRCIFTGFRVASFPVCSSLPLRCAFAAWLRVFCLSGCVESCILLSPGAVALSCPVVSGSYLCAGRNPTSFSRSYRSCAACPSLGRCRSPSLGPASGGTGSRAVPGVSPCRTAADSWASPWGARGCACVCSSLALTDSLFAPSDYCFAVPSVSSLPSPLFVHGPAVDLCPYFRRLAGSLFPFASCLSPWCVTWRAPWAHLRSCCSCRRSFLSCCLALNPPSARLAFFLTLRPSSPRLCCRAPFLLCCRRYFVRAALSSGFVAVPSVLVTGASQSRQHESRKSPIAELFDVDFGRISIVTVNTKDYHSRKYQKDNV